MQSDVLAVSTKLIFLGGLFVLVVFTCAFILMNKSRVQRRQRGLSQAQSFDLMQAIDTYLAKLPYISEFRKEQERQHLKTACIKQMPQVLDVITLGLTAGLSFDASLDLYCENYTDEMSDVFRKALLCWRLGSKTRSEALTDIAKDIDVQAFTSFSTAVLQALEFGAPLAGALKGQANTIRAIQKSEIEEQIEKVPVKMLVPLGTLIVPAMLLSILGPLLAGSVVGS